MIRVPEGQFIKFLSSYMFSLSLRHLYLCFTFFTMMRTPLKNKNYSPPPNVSHFLSKIWAFNTPFLNLSDHYVCERHQTIRSSQKIFSDDEIMTSLSSGHWSHHGSPGVRPWWDHCKTFLAMIRSLQKIHCSKKR